MTQFYVYKDAFGASGVFDVDMGNDTVRLGDLPPLEEKAEHLEAGSCTITFDDPDADLGHTGDAILGNQRISITETACPVGNRRLYTGLTGLRTYSRRPDQLILGAARQISVELHDLNALLSLRIIPNSDRSAIRPRESVTARLTWFLGTSYAMDVIDAGLVASNSTIMTKSDYRGQRGVNVVNDCEMAAGFGWNAFVYWNEATAERALFFDNANTSTAYTSTLRISNVLSDLDTFTSPTAVTFGPSLDAELTRDPSNLASGVYLPFQNDATFRERTDTITMYGRKDIAAPNSNIKSRDKAEAQADDLLWQHHTEEDRITVTVELPPSHVNLIRAGHRIQVRFQHLPGYESFRWCRVLSRAPGQSKETDDRYWMHLELSPQEVPCGDSVEPTFVQWELDDQTGNVVASPLYSYTYPLGSGTSIGDLLVVAFMSGTTFNSAVLAAPAGWSWPVQNERNALSGGQWCNVFYKTSEGDDSITVQLASPGGTHRVAFAEYAGLNNATLFNAPSLNLDDPGTGNATTGNSYPAGPAALISACFMSDGPTGTDDLFVEVGTAVLRTPIDGALHGSADVSLSDMLLDTTAGSDSWQLGNVGGGTNLSACLAFEGGDCGEVTAPETTPTPPPEDPSSETVTVTSLEDLADALADNNNLDITLAPDTYSDDFEADGRFAARTNPVIVRCSGVTLEGRLTFRDGAHHQTWEDLSFANITINEAGVVGFGGYAGEDGPHHITIRDFSVAASVHRTDATHTVDHTVYFSYSVGGAHDILIEDLTVEATDAMAIATGIHMDHGGPGDAPLVNAYNVTVRRLTFHGTNSAAPQNAIILWTPPIHDWTFEDCVITNAGEYALRFESIGAANIVFDNCVSTGTPGGDGFYSSLGNPPSSVTFTGGSSFG